MTEASSGPEIWDAAILNQHLRVIRASERQHKTYPWFLEVLAELRAAMREHIKRLRKSVANFPKSQRRAE
jgi:hypothetical protein